MRQPGESMPGEGTARGKTSMEGDQGGACLPAEVRIGRKPNGGTGQPGIKTGSLIWDSMASQVVTSSSCQTLPLSRRPGSLTQPTLLGWDIYPAPTPTDHPPHHGTHLTLTAGRLNSTLIPLQGHRFSLVPSPPESLTALEIPGRPASLFTQALLSLQPRPPTMASWSG